MEEIDFKALVDEARSNNMSDQRIADLLRANGFPQSSYRDLLPGAKLPEETVSDASKEASKFENVLKGAVSNVTNFAEQHPFAAGAATAALTGAAGYALGKRKAEPVKPPVVNPVVAPELPNYTFKPTETVIEQPKVTPAERAAQYEQFKAQQAGTQSPPVVAAPVQTAVQPVASSSEMAATGQSGSAVADAVVREELARPESGFKQYIKKAEEIKGSSGTAVNPASRRTKAETAIYKEETPYNRGFNQFSEMVGGKSNPQEMLRAWEDVHQNLWKGEMPKGQGGKMQFADTTEQYLRSKSQEYPNIVRHLDERAAKAAEKRAVVPPSNQGGFIDLTPPTLTPNAKAFIQGAKPVLVDTLKTGAAMAPFMLATDVRQQDVGYKRELQQQLKQEKDPARVQVLKNELDKLEEGRYLQAMYDRFVKKNVPEQYRPALTR